MDGVNKVLAAILGLVVIMILFAVITSKLNLGKTGTFSFKPVTQITPIPTNNPARSPTIVPRKGFFSFLNKPTGTPTSTQSQPNLNPTQVQNKGGFFSFFGQKPTNTPTPKLMQSKSQGGAAQSIPKTGPELFFPMVTASFLAGVYLRKRS